MKQRRFNINGGKGEVKQKFLIVLIASILTAVLTIPTTLYISYYLQPHVRAKYAWCELMFKEEQTKEGETIFKFWGEDIISGETMETEHIIGPFEFEYCGPEELREELEPLLPVIVPKQGYTGKILLENTGHSMATNIHIGIAFPFESDLIINATPNIQVENKPKESHDSYSFSFKVVIIKQLPRKSKAIITINWFFTEDDIPTIISSQFPDWRSSGYVPKLLFLSSDQGLHTIGNLTPFHEIIEEEVKIVGAAVPRLGFVLFFEERA